ncbi:hypothetical protein [Corynebacterium neomassiliense]|uniref:hypothetical protein n=1 Tax=Corynebacterium neomassiliense TaxID=2079482 RepID=UPI0010302F61|nr:hypothetical protein [Corynebacterium neomassiliense]
MSTRTTARMMGNDLSAAPCYCCNERRRDRGSQKRQERTEWRRDAHRGEVDGGDPWPTDDVHGLKELGGLCADWPDPVFVNLRWDYDQEDVPFWWYQAIIPPEYRLPHLTTT